MKKKFLLAFAVTISFFASAQCPTFTIGSPFGTVTGCNPNTVQLDALNTSTLSGVTYTWISASTGTQTGSSIFAACPGATNTFTVIASAPSNTCFSTQQITITSNTTAPIVIVSPASRTLTCNGACQSFTAVASGSTLSVVGTWSYSGGVITTGPSSSPLTLCANAPGMYTAAFTDTVTGCTATQTAAVMANSVIPSMTVVPGGSNGFTISCTNTNVPMSTSLSTIMAPFAYTWTPVANPTASTTPATGGYTATTPGQYVIDARDGNMCIVSTTVTIFIDTIRPAPFANTNLPGNSFTLSCNTTSLLATALSAPLLPSTSYAWIIPPNIPYSLNTITVGLSNITTSSTPTTYTVLAQNPNGCIRKSNVFFYKDTYIPPYTIVANPNAITCTSPTVNLLPMTSSTVPVTWTFTSPPPTTTSSSSPATFSIAGTYTMTYQNPFNGCVGVTTTVVPFNAVPPATFAVGPFVIPCGTSSTYISAGTNSLNPSYTYSWTGPAGANMDNPTGYFTSADVPGTYTVFINNFSNGCNAYNYVSLVQTTTLNVPITGLDTICVGYGTNLSTNVSGATSYSWNTGSTSNVIYVTPTVTTVYSIAVTNTTSGCSGSNTFTVNVSACVGIEEQLLNSQFSISPNPSNGKFEVKIKNAVQNAEIRLLNAIGQEVFKQNLKQGSNEINSTYLSKGIYYYRIYQNKEPVGVGKIIFE